MLGSKQKAWLRQQFSSSTASWQLLGNQTLFSPLTIGIGSKASIVLNRDSWDGYNEERGELLDLFARKPRVAVFTGDMHASLVSYIKSAYYHRTKADRQNIIGAEFMTPSISSPNVSDSTRALLQISGFTPLVRGIFELFNPHIKHFHGGFYGYSIAEITPDTLDWQVFKVDKKLWGPKVLRKHFIYYPEQRKLAKQALAPVRASVDNHPTPSPHSATVVGYESRSVR
jgi:alkaline phosphatase D